MTAEAPPLVATRLSASSVFSKALIVATILPFCSIAAAEASPATTLLAASLLIVGSTHVFATIYLLTDQGVRQFFGDHPLKMIAAPITLMIGSVVLFSRSSGAVQGLSYSVFFLYQAWHFGAQNIGVSTFISLSD